MNKMKVRAEYKEYKQQKSCFPLITADCLTQCGWEDWKLAESFLNISIPQYQPETRLGSPSFVLEQFVSENDKGNGLDQHSTPEIILEST